MFKWSLNVSDDRISSEHLAWIANQLGLHLDGRVFSGPYQQLVTAFGLLQLMKVDVCRLAIIDS